MLELTGWWRELELRQRGPGGHRIYSPLPPYYGPISPEHAPLQIQRVRFDLFGCGDWHLWPLAPRCVESQPASQHRTTVQPSGASEASLVLFDSRGPRMNNAQRRDLLHLAAQ